jgi:hypothetical protein
MEFPFPAISGSCPVCGRACGAIYRGYYKRWMICPRALFIGKLAIRTGFCRHEQKRFALFPEFLIPFRSFSREAFLKLWRAWKEKPGEVADSVDRWFDELDQEVCLSISTIYSQLKLILRQLRSGPRLFGTPPILPGGLLALLDISSAQVEGAIGHPAFGLAASLRIDPPP